SLPETLRSAFRRRTCSRTRAPTRSRTPAASTRPCRRSRIRPCNAIDTWPSTFLLSPERKVRYFEGGWRDTFAAARAKIKRTLAKHAKLAKAGVGRLSRGGAAKMKRTLAKHAKVRVGRLSRGGAAGS